MPIDLDLPAERDLAPGRKRQRRDHLVREINRTSTGARRRRWMAAVLVPALALAAAGATMYVRSRPSADPRLVFCVDRLTPITPTSPGDSSWIVDADGPRPLADPIGACQNVWRRHSRTPPAAMVACVPPGLSTYVYPKPPGMRDEDACASIGAALPANTRYSGATPGQMVAFDSDLQRRLNPPAVTPGCYPAQHARRVVRETLARHQLTRATVRDQAGTSRFADVLVIVERGDLVVSIRRPNRDCT
jgi:hypothetical protein